MRERERDMSESIGSLTLYILHASVPYDQYSFIKHNSEFKVRQEVSVLYITDFINFYFQYLDYITLHYKEIWI